MRDYGSVQTRFWTNPDIQKLSPQAELLALYLLTSPHTNMLGCFRIPTGYIVEDLQLDKQNITKCIAELTSIGFLNRDEHSGWTLIINFLEWNEIENPNQAKSIIKLFDQVPESTRIFTELVDTLLNNKHGFDEPFRNRLETLSKGLAKGSETLSKPFRNQEQEQKQEQKQDQEHTTCRERSLSTEISHEKNQHQAVINIPLNNNQEFEIRQDLVAQWKKLYPAVDVLQELRNIRGWNLANPNRRKTKSGVIKHINTWLSKAQNNPHQPHGRSPPSSHNSSLLEYNKAVASEWLRKLDREQRKR